MPHYLPLLLCVVYFVIAQQTTRCGKSWNDANTSCNSECIADADCPSGSSCFANLDPCPTTPTTPTTPPPASSIRCGPTWVDANNNCSAVMCTVDLDCPSGQSCFNALDTCQPTPPTPPIAPTPPFTLPPSVPTSPSSPCRNPHTLTLSELNQFMGRSESDQSLVNWVEPLNSALARYSMNCPLRIATFLAQVRHETAGMSIFHQPADNGAGALHMTPSNWPYACNGVPEIAAAFANQFPGCTNCSCTAEMATDQFGTNTTTAANLIFSQPLVAVLSGTWWFASGARTPSIFGWKGCGDLRLDSDVGLGAPGPSDCYHTGYYQVTCCIFYTITGAAGMTQRLQYYNIALSVISDWATTEPDNTVPGSDKLPVPAIIGISVGVIVVVVIIVVAIVVLAIRNDAEPKEYIEEVA